MRRLIPAIMVVSAIGLSSANVPADTVAITKLYQPITLQGGYATGHLADIWDLTAGDVTIRATVDLTGVRDDPNGHAWTELGVRQYGAGDWNPTWMTEGAGVWLATDFDGTAGTFAPDPYGKPAWDNDDKLILQKGGGLSETSYNLPQSAAAATGNYGLWFDRDGVNQTEAGLWGAVSGGTYTTAGRYKVVITLHATSPTTGTAFIKVNGIQQGFYTQSRNDQPQLYPAGMTFTGNMTRMQVFYGLYGYGPSLHTVLISDLEVDAQPPDTTPPATSASLSGTTGDNGWYTSDVDVALTAADNAGGRGVKEIHYSVAGGAASIVTGDQASLHVSSEGTTTVSYYAVDNAGNAEAPKSLSVGIDKSAPAITNVTTSNSLLWPANHKMIQVAVVYGATDSVTGSTCSTSVASNEPVNGPDDGDTAPDWQVIDASTVFLRAERSGSGGGRIYTITATCRDGAGNTSSKTAAVMVPLNRGR